MWLLSVTPPDFRAGQSFGVSRLNECDSPHRTNELNERERPSVRIVVILRVHGTSGRQVKSEIVEPRYRLSIPQRHHSGNLLVHLRVILMMAIYSVHCSRFYVVLLHLIVIADIVIQAASKNQVAATEGSYIVLLVAPTKPSILVFFLTFRCYQPLRSRHYKAVQGAVPQSKRGLLHRSKIPSQSLG